MGRLGAPPDAVTESAVDGGVAGVSIACILAGES